MASAYPLRAPWDHAGDETTTDPIDHILGKVATKTAYADWIEKVDALNTKNSIRLHNT